MVAPVGEKKQKLGLWVKVLAMQQDLADLLSERTRTWLTSCQHPSAGTTKAFGHRCKRRRFSRSLRPFEGYEHLCKGTALAGLRDDW